WGKIDVPASECGDGGSEVGPLNYAFRGLRPNFTSNWLNHIKSTGQTSSIDGTACTEYAVTDAGSDSGTRFWLDPTKDYVVRRIPFPRNRGERPEQMEVRYEPNKDAGWVPTSWVHTEYSKEGAVRSTTTYQVLSIRLNEPIPATEFELHFETGTLVD